MELRIEMPVFSAKELNDHKAQCVKVLEEASELCEASKILFKNDPNYMGMDVPELRKDMLGEFADVLQTLVNLAKVFNITDREINNAVKDCIARNEERERY